MSIPDRVIAEIMGTPWEPQSGSGKANDKKGENMSRYDDAYEFAKKCHDGQLYGGRDYFDAHVAKVAAAAREWSEDAGIVGLLHDTVEDGKSTLEEISDIFGDYIGEAVKTLTRIEGENYFDYIGRIGYSLNEESIIVKSLDLRENLKQLIEGSLKDKYRFALMYIFDVMSQCNLERKS